MDGPGDYFPGLELFSPNILACIAEFIPGEQLLRLKCTGARILWHRLRHPQVVKSINLGTDFIRFYSWPAFLNELPTIEELSIYSRSQAWWSEFGITLKSIPPTLRRLKLGGEMKSFDSFFFNFKVPIEFGKYAPQLVSLDMGGTFAYDRLVRHLPGTLTTLCLAGFDHVSELPHLLVHLTVKYTGNMKVWMPNLPQLVSIDTDIVPDFHGLPRSLKSISGAQLSVSDLNNLPESMGFIPPSLTKLNLAKSVLPSSSWPFLPATLQTLCICVSNSECATTKVKAYDPENDTAVEVPHYPIELLPRSLTYLEIYKADNRWNRDERIFLSVPSENLLPTSLDSGGFPVNSSSSHPIEAMFPPHLTTLIACKLVLSPNAAAHLPVSLTRLRILLLYDHMCKHIPRGLTDLKASKVLMSPKLISLLPKSLTKLGFKYNSRVGVKVNYYTGRTNDYDIGTEAELHRAFRNYLDWKSNPLPPSLTSLQLGGFTQLGNSIVRDQSLQHMQELLIPDSFYFSDVAIPFLSRILTTLDLSSACIVSGKCFPFLPKGLVELRLRKSSKIFDPEISHLPRHLKVLYLNAATILTDSCICDFPRHLEYLDLSHNTNITRNCYADLPYPIRSCCTFIACTWSVNAGEIGTRP